MVRNVLQAGTFNTALVVVGWTAFILGMTVGHLNPVLSARLMVIARIRP